jgi:isoquinoline 1-oxidoreductase subunit beta
MHMTNAAHIDRRAVLAGLSGLVVAVHLDGTAQARDQAAAPAELGPFIRVAGDGAVTIITPCVEMGQGSHTALAMIVADELGADWAKVTAVAPPVATVYRTPGRAFQNTSGSQMVRRWHGPLRRSAAAAREMLVQAAADQWRVDPAECLAADGRVRHLASSRELNFGMLAATAARLPEPKEPKLRQSNTLVGTDVPRLDIPAKVNGAAVFGVDVRVPDMVFAAIRQAPVYGSKLLSVDDARLRGQPGIIDVVKLPEAVAVVAASFWQAKKAVEALQPVFGRTQQDRVTSDEIMRIQRATLDAPSAAVGISSGDVSRLLAPGAAVVHADYSVPFLHHATMEPLACTAHLTQDKFEFWVPTQNPTGVQQVGAKVSGLSPDRIIVNSTLLGGGFGRKFEQDFVEQTALIAKAVKRPVKLIWSREEDVQHGFYRPAMSARLSAQLDAEGYPEAMILRVVGPSVIEHTIGQPTVNGVDPVAMLGISTETPHSPSRIQQYAIGNFRAEYIYEPTHVPVGYWRAVGATENGFFIESFIDELAARAKKDPVAFRRHLLRDSTRGLAVLDKVAAESNWSKPLPPGRFRGVAFSECVGSMFAAVAELSMEGEVPKVHRIVCAIDCGKAIHPRNVIRQVEGCVVMGLSSALHEKITIAAGRCEQSNFHDYRMLGIADVPQIEVHLIESGAALGGVGEAGVPAIAPAVANAIHAATGKRIRSLPIVEA